MFVRVVRFTDVTTERVEAVLARIQGSEERPPGIPATKVTMLFDEGQGTAVVLQHFETEEDMTAGGQAFAAMDPSDTPGTRASVDTCVVKVDQEL